MNLPAFIDTEEDCNKLFEMLADEPLVALDSEFVWNRSYFPFVGIVQIGISPEKSFIIDTATLSECPKSFKAFLRNENIMKVCHDAFQDVQILNYYAKTTTRNVFDSQLAASFLGLGRAISLGDLIDDLFGKTLDKTEQRANWVNRPLTDAQIEYALDDVRYLADCARILIERAQKRGILEWILEDCQEFSNIKTPFEFSAAVEKAYAKEVRMVSYKSRPKLYRLCSVTENLVREKNLPRSFMFKPGVLAEIINCNPINQKTLQRTSLPKKMQNKYAELFANAINDESIAVNEKLVKSKLSHRSPEYVLIGDLTKEFSEMLERIAKDKEISSSRIYNKKQITELVRETVESKKIAKLHGWRDVFLSRTWKNFWKQKNY